MSSFADIDRGPSLGNEQVGPEQDAPELDANKVALLKGAQVTSAALTAVAVGQEVPETANEHDGPSQEELFEAHVDRTLGAKCADLGIDPEQFRGLDAQITALDLVDDLDPSLVAQSSLSAFASPIAEFSVAKEAAVCVGQFA